MSKIKSIDLNADIGEGMPYDEELIKLISSCNIACGGHVGDDESILNTINMAKANHIKIGAHPSYPDKHNFGRHSMDISIQKLTESIDYQLNSFKTNIDKLQANWHHIKFHGALYNDLKHDKLKAEALVELIENKYKNVSLYVPPNSVIKTTAEKRIKVHVEGFADRAYNNDLSLVSRLEASAILSKNDEVVNQVLNKILNKKIKTVSGKWVTIHVDTICLHGDNPKALELAKTIVDMLQNQNINIK